jgi:hypothetical protein
MKVKSFCKINILFVRYYLFGLGLDGMIKPAPWHMS